MGRHLPLGALSGDALFTATQFRLYPELVQPFNLGVYFFIHRKLPHLGYFLEELFLSLIFHSHFSNKAKGYDAVK